MGPDHRLNIFNELLVNGSLNITNGGIVTSNHARINSCGALIEGAGSNLTVTNILTVDFLSDLTLDGGSLSANSLNIFCDSRLSIQGTDPSIQTNNAICNGGEISIFSQDHDSIRHQ